MVLDEPGTGRYQIPIPTGTIARLQSQTCIAVSARARSRKDYAMAYRSAETIDDLQADSLIQKVMLADHVEPRALKTLLDGTARRIANARQAGTVQVGQDLGRRGWLRGPLLLMRPTTRATGGECGASLCG